jgi:hypothetical protein
MLADRNDHFVVDGQEARIDAPVFLAGSQRGRRPASSRLSKESGALADLVLITPVPLVSRSP